TAAVDARLVPVLDPIVAARLLADTASADAAAAIGVLVARGAHRAGCAVAPAIHVGLGAIPEAIVAAGGEADAPEAAPAFAIARDLALFPDAARRAGAAAVDVALVSIQDAVTAVGLRADPIGAVSRSTLLVAPAFHAIEARGSSSAAGHVRFVRSYLAVVTARKGDGSARPVRRIRLLQLRIRASSERKNGKQAENSKKSPACLQAVCAQ